MYQADAATDAARQVHHPQHRGTRPFAIARQFDVRHNRYHVPGRAHVGPVHDPAFNVAGETEEEFAILQPAAITLVGQAMDFEWWRSLLGPPPRAVARQALRRRRSPGAEAARRQLCPFDVWRGFATCSSIARRPNQGDTLLLRYRLRRRTCGQEEHKTTITVHDADQSGMTEHVLTAR